MQVEPLSLLHFVPNYITNCGDLPRKSLQTLKKHQKLGKNDDEMFNLCSQPFAPHIDFWLAKTQFYRLDPSLNPIQFIRCDFFLL